MTADRKNKSPGMSYVSVPVCLYWLNLVQGNIFFKLFSLSISGSSLAPEVVELGSEGDCQDNVKPDFLKINSAGRSKTGLISGLFENSHPAYHLSSKSSFSYF